MKKIIISLSLAVSFLFSLEVMTVKASTRLLYENFDDQVIDNPSCLWEMGCSRWCGGGRCI